MYIIAQMEGSKFIEFCRTHINNTDFISNITSDTRFANGGFAVFPFGTFSQRLSDLIVFDELNITNILLE
jgi:hypothetical protein